MREIIKVDNITIDDVKQRLQMLGFTVTDEDNPLIEFQYDYWVSFSLDFMNRDDMPNEVVPKVIDKICHDVLLYKKNSGRLPEFDDAPLVSELKEGDTTIKYNNEDVQGYNKKRFNLILNRLDSSLNYWLVRHRKIKW